MAGDHQRPGSETRSFSAATIGVRPVATAASPPGGGLASLAPEGVSPWLDPLRLARAFREHFLYWGVTLGGLCCVVGMLIGAAAFHTTFTLSASLQLATSTTPFDAARDTATYRPPELNAKEMQSLLEQQFIFERLLPMMDAGEHLLDFRERFNIKLARDANVYTVTFRGAPSPERAEEILDSYFQIILSTAKEILLNRSQKDLDYFKGEVASADQQLQIVLSRLDDLRQQQGFVYLEQEIVLQQTKIAKVEDLLQDARTRLREATYQIEAIPLKLAEIPREVEIPFRDPPAISNQLSALKSELRKLQTLYTEEHPQVKYTRDELTRLEAEYQQQLEETKKSHTAPNPLSQKLSEQLKLYELQKPQLEREVAELEAKLEGARTYLNRLPAIAANYQKLDEQRSNQVVLLDRMKARLAEIEIARSISLNTVRVLDPPNAGNAERSPRMVKTALLGLGGLAGGLSLAALLAGFLAIRDRRFRSLEDCVQILGAERVALLPHNDDEQFSEHRRWLQDICGHLSHQRRRFLFIPGPNRTVSNHLAAALANQFGCSGLTCLLLADLDLPSNSDPSEVGHRSGVTHIINRSASLHQSVRRISDQCLWLPWGDVSELLARLPSGEVERSLQNHLRSLGTFDILMIVPPIVDTVLLRRLGPLCDCLVPIIDPDETDGAELLGLVEAIAKPVAMGIFTR